LTPEHEHEHEHEIGADRKARVDLCGCRAPSRRRCELCSETGDEHLACSRSCLEKHWRKRHGRTHEKSIGARTRRQQALQNDASESNWHSFAGHRARVTGLLRTLQRGEGLCVLGAGNGDDLDLAALVREFGEVHLVDLDGAALERAQERAPAPFASSVVLHGDVDLTGLLDGIERWGDDDGALFAQAEEAAAAVAARLGRTFDVVLSSCVLSQLCAPFTRVLARRPEEWRALMALVGRTHFQLMARLLRPGGTGVALGDIYYGPAAAHAATALTWASLDRRAEAALREAVMRLRDPHFLAQLLAGPELRDLVVRARLSEPWLWQVEQAAMLVYAVIFQRS
jgi:SAM-dependent methyltransferase